MILSFRIRKLQTSHVFSERFVADPTVRFRRDELLALMIDNVTQLRFKRLIGNIVLLPHILASVVNVLRRSRCTTIGVRDDVMTNVFRYRSKRNVIDRDFHAEGCDFTRFQCPTRKRQVRKSLYDLRDTFVFEIL